MTWRGAEKGGVEDMRHVKFDSSRRRGAVCGLWLLLLAAACASSSTDRSIEAPTPASAPAAAAPATSPATLQEIATREGAPGTEVDLRAEG